MIKNRLEGLNENMSAVNKKLDEVKEEIMQIKEVGATKKEATF